MLTGFTLGNFKAIGKEQFMPIKPLTLIFGPNSSGKSSLIHGLLLANHGLATGNINVVHTPLGGTMVDLGGYSKYLYKRDQGLRQNLPLLLGFEYEAKTFAETLLRRFKRGILDNIDKIRVDLAFIYSESTVQPELRTFTISADGNLLLEAFRVEDTKFEIKTVYPEHIIVQRLLDYSLEMDVTEKPYSKRARKLQRPSQYSYEVNLQGQIPKGHHSILPIFYGEDTDEYWDILDTFANTIRSDARSIHKAINARRSKRGVDNVALLNRSLGNALADFINNINEVIRKDITSRLSYLGPIRSMPPRYILAEGDLNPDWKASGGEKWDILKKKPDILVKVNRFLGSSTMQTRYELKPEKYYSLQLLEHEMRAYAQSISLATADMMESIEEEKAASPDKIQDENEKYYGDSKHQITDLEAFDTEAILGVLHNRIAKEATPELTDIVLYDLASKTVVSHKDVGVGISQVLPVLVAAYASNRKTICIEQPEIHIHPALQAELGDVLIESAMGETMNSLIVETHSEHLILRILKRIRETSSGNIEPNMLPIKPDDIAVIYAMPSAKGTILKNLRISKEGDFIDKWPNGFFADRIKELI